MAEQFSVSSMFGDVLKSSAQQNLEADRALGLQMAQNSGQAAVMLAPERARSLTGAIGGLFGIQQADPQAENKKLFNQLMQSAMSQYPNSRAKQLEMVSNELMRMGKTQEAMKASDAAYAAKMQEAQVANEQAQAYQRTQAGVESAEKAATVVATRKGEVDKLAAQIATEAAKQSELGSREALTAEQLTTEIMTRNPKISKIDAETAAAKALADQRNIESKIALEESPLKRNLLRAQTQAELAGVKLDEKKVQLVASQISTEAVKQRAEEQNISLNQAKEQLVDAELERYIAMTPLEILKANTQVAKDNVQMELDKARLGDVGMTEFTRNLEQLDISKEEKQKLLKRYTEAKAMSGGVTGMGEAGLSSKIKIVEKGINLADGASKAMDTAQSFIRLIPEMNTGFGSSVFSFFNYMGSQLNIPESEKANFANQLGDVLLSKITLDQASALKGALSDKDLQFLKDAVGTRKTLTADVLQEIFTRLYQERYADQKVAEQMERVLSYDDATIRSTNLVELENNVRDFAMKYALTQLEVPVKQ